MLTNLSSAPLAIVVALIVVGATVIGIVAGRSLASRSRGLREPLGIVQGALVGFVALLLAFGLTMAVGRYETRRSALVDEANAIGTTYLRAQTLPEPLRSKSLALLVQYTDARIALSNSVPESSAFDARSRESVEIQNQLWAIAGDALHLDPAGNVSRLYVETLNEMINTHTTRVAALENRIPSSVLFVQLFASALALSVLAMSLATHDRGVFASLLAAGLVTLMLLVIFDLDRPYRGLISITDRPLTALRSSMNDPPAASGS